MIYSLPYITLLSIYLVLFIIQQSFNLTNNSRYTLNLFVGLTYIVFFGFRGFIATDWINYYNYYSSLGLNLETLKDSYTEPGFVLFSIISKWISNDYFIYQLINTIVNFTLLHIFFSRYLHKSLYPLAFAVFLAFYGLLFEVNLFRNFKSLLIFLLSIKYLESREPIKYYVLIFISLLFHWSAILYFPLYFFLHKRVSIYFFIGVVVLGSVLYFFQVQYFSSLLKWIIPILPSKATSKILFYSSNLLYSKSFGISFTYIEKMFVILLVIVNYRSFYSTISSTIFSNCLLLYVSIFLYCSELSIVIQRVAGNFAFSYWIVIPLAIYYSRNSIRYLIMFFLLPLLLAKLHTVTNLIFYRYDSVLLDNCQSYHDRKRIYDKYHNEIEKKLK